MALVLVCTLPIPSDTQCLHQATLLDCPDSLVFLSMRTLDLGIVQCLVQSCGLWAATGKCYSSAHQHVEDHHTRSAKWFPPRKAVGSLKLSCSHPDSNSNEIPVEHGCRRPARISSGRPKLDWSPSLKCHATCLNRHHLG